MGVWEPALRSLALVVSDRRQTKALSRARARVVRDLSLDLRRSPRNMEGRGGERFAAVVEDPAEDIGADDAVRCGRVVVEREWRGSGDTPKQRPNAQATGHRRAAARIGWLARGWSSYSRVRTVEDKGYWSRGAVVQGAAIVLWMGWWVVGCLDYCWFGLEGKPSPPCTRRPGIQYGQPAN
jgi:hypothetical protein